MSGPVSHLTDLPNPSNFGESFNYAVWTPNTQVELCNVPWNSDYRDIVEFASQAALDAYLDGVAGPTVKIAKMTLARAGAPVRINLPFNACYKYNYLRVNNGTNPIGSKYVDPNGNIQTVTDVPKTMYYFIQDVQYLAPNTTQLSVMLDVWQTFGRDVNFGNCYIERGHIGIANQNQFTNQGRDYLTVPEGLDVGGEYLVNRTHSFQLPDGADVYTDPRPEGAWVVVGIAADVQNDPGDTSSPNLTTGGMSFGDGLPNGFNTLYFQSILDYEWFILNYRQQPWITQTIMFITLIPPLANFDQGGSPLVATSVWDTSTKTTRNDKAYTLETNGSSPSTRKLVDNWRDDALSFIPDRYKMLKKFLTSPYCWIELTTYNAAPLMLKPELMPDDDINVKIYQHAVPPTPRWAIVPQHYNATGISGTEDDGEFLDMATYISNFPQFTVLNNNYLEYLASNKNSIAYAYNSAEWSQQKALQGAQTSYDNVQSGISNSMNQAAIQQNANNARTDLQNRNEIIHGASGVLAGLMSGNPATALAEGVTSVVNTGIAVSNANAQNSITNNAIQASNTSQNVYASEVGGRNYDFAQYAAKGDYQNAINAVQARVQDAKMIQPTSVGQLGGESFIASLMGIIGLGYGVGWRIYTKIKQIDHNYMALIGEYWLRYGYAINRFGTMPDSFKCMTKFTYWKLKETYITSSLCPEVYKQTIRGIFEKGVTVWVNPNDIGNIDLADNQPLAGISL